MASNLKGRRLALGLSQAAIARKLGIAETTWCRWENRSVGRHLLPFERDCPVWLDLEVRKLEVRMTRFADIKQNV